MTLDEYSYWVGKEAMKAQGTGRHQIALPLSAGALRRHITDRLTNSRRKLLQRAENDARQGGLMRDRLAAEAVANYLAREIEYWQNVLIFEPPAELVGDIRKLQLVDDDF